MQRDTNVSGMECTVPDVEVFEGFRDVFDALRLCDFDFVFLRKARAPQTMES